MTPARCDYIEACVDRVFGTGSLAQQEILEVGCGGGLICEELAQRKVIMVGIDPARNALAIACEHAQQGALGPYISYEYGYAESLPYADGSFSAIVCFDVLEHVGNIKATIREISRVLAPGGVFVFDTINRTLLSRVALLWFGEHFLSALTPGLHIYSRFIKPTEIHAQLTAAGLRVQEMRGFIPRGFAQGQIKMGTGPFMGVSYV